MILGLGFLFIRCNKETSVINCSHIPMRLSVAHVWMRIWICKWFVRINHSSITNYYLPTRLLTLKICFLLAFKSTSIIYHTRIYNTHTQGLKIRNKSVVNIYSYTQR